MPGSLSVKAWKPSCRSCAGAVPMPPQISTTLPCAFPGPPSSFTAYSPAALPISTLSPPMNWVMRLVSTLRSSTMTGILASIAFSTTPVRPADSFGEMSSASTCWTMRFSTSATCFSVLSWPSVMMSVTSGWFLASASMSLLNCTRHGSSVVAWLKPIFHFAAAFAGVQPAGRQSVVAAPVSAPLSLRNSGRFMHVLPFDGRLSGAWRPTGAGRSGQRRRSGRSKAPPACEKLAEILFLHEDRADDDEPFHQELHVGIDVLELQDVGEQAEDEHADECACEAAAPTHQTRAADDDRRDRVELEAGAGVRLALPVLRDEEDGRHAGEQARNDIRRELDLRHLDARKLSRLGVAADGVDVAAERREAQNGAERDNRGEKKDARHGHKPPNHRTQDLESLGRVRAGVDGDDRVVLAGREAADAERAHHHGEGCDERLQSALDDERAVDRPEHERKAGRRDQDREHAEFRRDLGRREEKSGGGGGEADERGNAPAAPGVEHDLAPAAGVDVAAALESVEYEADEQRRGEADRNRGGRHAHDRRRGPARLGQQHRADDGRAAHDRTDRQIDAAQEDNDGHAGRDQAGDRDLPQDVGQIVVGEEDVAARRGVRGESRADDADEREPPVELGAREKAKEVHGVSTVSRLARPGAASRMIASWLASDRRRILVCRPSHMTSTRSDRSKSSGISELTTTMPRP